MNRQDFLLHLLIYLNVRPSDQCSNGSLFVYRFPVLQGERWLCFHPVLRLQRRFWPAAQRIRAAIDDGTLGRPVLGQCSVMLQRDPEYYSRDAWRGTWASDGGGVLMTQAIHYIDLLQWFMGDVAEVYGKINTYKHGGHIEVEDSATAVITFTSGAMATLEASTAVTPSLGVQLRVTGETGASASLTEFPEGSDGRVDLWAVGETISTEPAHPEGIHPNVDLATIQRPAHPAPHHPGPRFRSGPPGRHGPCHHRPGRHQGTADPAGRL